VSASTSTAAEVRDSPSATEIEEYIRGLNISTIFFGTDTQHERAAVIHRDGFNFMSEARIWYSRNRIVDFQ
jgi:hypothetical protein